MNRKKRSRTKRHGLTARLASLLAAAACVSAILGGCKPGGDPSSSGPVSVENLEGRTVRIMSWTGTDLEPQQGESEREDRQYDYLRRLEEEYNFTFEFIEIPYYQLMSTYISGVTAGDPPADIINVSIRSFYPALVTKNMIMPLSDFEYFNFADEKWAPLQIETGTYNGKVYGCATERRAGMVVFWNKSMFEREGLPDLYALQDEGTWTWDRMREIAQQASKDTDGDGRVDQYGFGGEFYPQYQAVYSNDASFIDFVDGKPEFMLGEASGIESLQFIADLKQLPNVWCPPLTGWDHAFHQFREGKVAMCVGEFWVANNYNFSEMEDAYGAVLFPKGPKADDYVSVTSDFGLYTIPTSTQNPEQIAFILDKYLTPLEGEDPETAWKSQLENNFTDAGTEKTFEMMMDGRVEFTYLEMFHDSIASLYNEFMPGVESGAVSPTAQMEAYGQRAQSMLDDVFTIANGGQLQDGNEEVKTIEFKGLAWIPQEVNVTKEIINQWNLEHPDIQVVFTQGNWGTLEDEMISGFASGVLPQIFHYTASAVNTWKSMGELEDLSSILSAEDQKDFDPGSMKLLTDDEGKVYAIPYQYETEIMLYNKDLFAQAGITAPTFENPWSFDDLVAAATALTNKDEEVYGLGVLGYENPMNYFNINWSTKLNQGLVYQEENGSYSIKVQDAFKDIMSGMNRQIADGVMPPESTTGYQGMSAFRKGNVAILAGGGSYNRYELASVNTDLNWGVLPPIKVENQNFYGQTQTFSIPANTRLKEEAKQFLQFFCNEENQAKLAAASYQMPGRLSAARRPELNTGEMGWDVVTRISTEFRTTPAFAYLPTWDNFAITDGSALYVDMINGVLTVDQFAQQLETEAGRVLRKIR